MCQGQTNVLDFESLTEPGIEWFPVGTVYREDGFVLACVEGPNGFASLRTEDPRYPGSTALFNNSIDDWTSLSKSNAASFDVLGIKLSWFTFQVAYTAQFYGYRGSLVVFTQECAMTGASKSQTFTFTGLTNLTELRWRNVSPGFQFDDIQVKSDAEPGTRVRLLPRPINSVFGFDMVHLRVGKNYTVERSADLVNWQPFATNFARSASQVIGEWAWQIPHKFYRVRYEE